jgi:hypothetical protein
MIDLLDAEDSLYMSVDKLRGIADLMGVVADGAYFKPAMLPRIARLIAGELDALEARLDLLDAARKDALRATSA